MDMITRLMTMTMSEDIIAVLVLSFLACLYLYTLLRVVFQLGIVVEGKE